MSTVQDIKTAIQRLSQAEREELVAELPRLLPELDGDTVWENISRDTRPRPKLSALLDQAQTEARCTQTVLTDTSESEFDHHS